MKKSFFQISPLRELGMAWAAKRQAGASGSNGLIHLKSENTILLEVRFCASFYCLPFLIFDCLHGSLFFFFLGGGQFLAIGRWTLPMGSVALLLVSRLV